MAQDPAQPTPKDPPKNAEVPRRPFGQADARVSILGVGGHHLGDLKSVGDCVQFVHAALDAGINFFDNCWEYYNGRTEDWLGRGPQGKRDRAFVMTKVCTHGRDAHLAMRMLDESLRRLQTDHLDLWQIHGVAFDNDPALAYARGGVVEALDQAKKLGKARFVGFTGHKSPLVHLEMLRRGFPFDSVQMPLNPFDSHFLSFEKIVLPEANKRGMAVLGMKPMGGTAAAVKKGAVTGEELLRYAMSLPVTVTISGMDSLDVLHKNVAIARGFKPLGAAAMQALRDKVAEPAGDGRFEPYKVSLKFDNPWARMPHDFPLDSTQREVQEMFQKEAGGP